MFIGSFNGVELYTNTWELSSYKMINIDLKYGMLHLHQSIVTHEEVLTKRF